MSLIGPGLLDLQLVTSSSLTTVAGLLSGRAIGGIGGLLLLGYSVEDHLGTLWSQLSVFSLLSAVFYGYASWAYRFWLQLLCFVLYGFTGTFVMTGSAIGIHRLFNRPEDNKKWFGISQVVLYLGGFVGPLILRPFLTENDSTTHRMGPNNPPWSRNFRHNYVRDIGHHPDHPSSPDTLVMYGFTIAAATMFFTAIVMFIGGAFLGGVTFQSREKEEEKEQEDMKRKDSRSCWRSLQVILLMCFSFLQAEYVRGFIAFIVVFTVRYQHWTKSTALILSSITFLAFAIYKLISIFVLKIQPQLQISLGLSLCTIASIVLSLFTQYHNAVFWVCTIALGIGSAAVVTAKSAWISESFGLKSQNIIYMSAVASSLGEALFSLLIGYLLENASFESVMYLTIGCTATSLVIMYSMQLIKRKCRQRLMEKKNGCSDDERQPLLNEQSHEADYKTVSVVEL